jgi:heterodisulfide reductase subunit A
MSEETLVVSAEPAPEAETGRRIGVYVCHCGGNISDYVDVEQVIEGIRDNGDVVVSRTAMFACSDATQSDIVADIQANQLDGLVVASCSPKLHTYTFRGVAARAGLNPYEYTQVNIREQCSWVHTDDPAAATAKATALVEAGISRTRNTVPLVPLVVETLPHTLVIGGGIAGLRAAVGLADIGLRVTLVERELELGGWVRRFGPIYPHDRKGTEQAPVDHRAHQRGARREGRQLRQLPGQPPHRRRGRGDDRSGRRVHRRRHRLRQLPARRG